jgi:hypothetical protein
MRRGLREVGPVWKRSFCTERTRRYCDRSQCAWRKEMEHVTCARETGLWDHIELPPLLHSVRDATAIRRAPIHTQNRPANSMRTHADFFSLLTALDFKEISKKNKKTKKN